MARIAFIVLKSPEEQDPSRMIKRLSDAANATAILFEDGVYQALLKAPAAKLRESASEVLVSQDDLEARGYSAADIKVGRVASYLEMIECIMERTEKSVTI